MVRKAPYQTRSLIICSGTIFSFPSHLFHTLHFCFKLCDYLINTCLFYQAESFMKVGRVLGLQILYVPGTVAQCLVSYSTKTIASLYGLLYRYKNAFLLYLKKLIFQSEMEVFPSGYQKKEQRMFHIHAPQRMFKII